MRVTKAAIDGLLLIEPETFADSRGFFLESYHAARYRDAGVTGDFVQDNHSRSVKGALRGLHYRVKHPQAQIVTVMRGRIFDVTVDLRPGSASFGRWFGVELGDDGPCQLYLPPGFAHGFCVLSDAADLHYKVSRLYDAADEAGLLWSDPGLGIAWPVAAPVVSARDAAHPRLCDVPHESLPHAG